MHHSALGDSTNNNTISNNSDTLLDILCHLQRRVENLERWKSVESKITEEEVCSRAMEHMRQQGFDVVKLPIQQIHSSDGRGFVEWDGIFVADKQEKHLLCVVEAKHQVNADHIANRVIALEKFGKWLTEPPTMDNANLHPLYRCTHGALAPFRSYDLQLFLGGTLFSQENIENALEHRIVCVHIDKGDRYDVSVP